MAFRPTRVQPGVPSGGEFSAHLRREGSFTLGNQALPVNVHHVLAMFPEPGLRASLEEKYESISGDGARALFAQTLDAHANPESRYEKPYRGGQMNPMTPELAEELAGLGYTDINDLAPGNLGNAGSLQSILKHRIGPERLRRLNEQGRSLSEMSAREREAYRTAPSGV